MHYIICFSDIVSCFDSCEISIFTPTLQLMELKCRKACLSLQNVCGRGQELRAYYSKYEMLPTV